MDHRVIKTELTCDRILDIGGDDDDDYLFGCITTGDFLKAVQEV
jgi:hypothetical protein